jgi:hypothetical protein
MTKDRPQAEKVWTFQFTEVWVRRWETNIRSANVTRQRVADEVGEVHFCRLLINEREKAVWIEIGAPSASKWLVRFLSVLRDSLPLAYRERELNEKHSSGGKRGHEKWLASRGGKLAQALERQIKEHLRNPDANRISTKDKKRWARDYEISTRHVDRVLANVRNDLGLTSSIKARRRRPS